MTWILVTTCFEFSLLSKFSKKTYILKTMWCDHVTHNVVKNIEFNQNWKKTSKIKIKLSKKIMGKKSGFNDPEPKLDSNYFTAASLINYNYN